MYAVLQGSAAAAVAIAGAVFSNNFRQQVTAIGELSETGQLVEVADAEDKLRKAKAGGFTRVVVPYDNYLLVRHPTASMPRIVQLI